MVFATNFSTKVKIIELFLYTRIPDKITKIIRCSLFCIFCFFFFFFFRICVYQNYCHLGYFVPAPQQDNLLMDRERNGFPVSFATPSNLCTFASRQRAYDYKIESDNFFNKNENKKEKENENDWEPKQSSNRSRSNNGEWKTTKYEKFGSLKIRMANISSSPFFFFLVWTWLFDAAALFILPVNVLCSLLFFHFGFRLVFYFFRLFFV